MKTQCGNHIVRGHNVEYHYRKWLEFAKGAEGTERESFIQQAEYCLRDLAPRENRASETTPSDNEPQANRRGSRNHKRVNRQHRNKVKA